MRKLTREEIHQAADDIMARGDTPSQEKVRAAYGDRGSMSTICAHLREWREKRDGAARLIETEVSPQLQHRAILWIAELHREIREQFANEATRQAADARRHEEELRADRDAALGEADSLAHANADALARLATALDDLATAERLLAERVGLIAGLEAQAKIDSLLIASLKEALNAKPRRKPAAKRSAKASGRGAPKPDAAA